MTWNTFADRPGSLEDFVGQRHIKDLIEITIRAAKNKNRPFPHTLLMGSAGLGKTTLAAIIANSIGVNFKAVPAEAIEKLDDVRRELLGLDKTGHDCEGNVIGDICPTILFIDEIHKLKRPAQELFYQALEDRHIEFLAKDSNTKEAQSVRVWVPSFTLIGATDRPNDLTTALRDRLEMNLILEPYTDEDAAQIAVASMHSFNYGCTPHAAMDIAKRSRGTPRKVKRFCKRVRDLCDANVFGDRYEVHEVTSEVTGLVFDMLKIDQLGLTSTDRKYLRYLKESPRAVGLKTLASCLSMEERQVEEDIESYLIQKGLVVRTEKGRSLTPKGGQHLEEGHTL